MYRQRGFSLLDLIITVAIIATLAALVTPQLLRARLQANDAAAVANMKSIQTAQSIYAISYPQQGYADNLARLGDPVQGQPSVDAAALLPPTIACPAQPCQHNGFMYEIYRTSGHPVGLYWVRARPVSVGRTGTNSYHTMNDDRIAVDANEGLTLQDSGEGKH